MIATYCRTAMFAALISVGLLSWPGMARTQQAISFNRDIRPILSNNCFLCHGPDEKGRKADLRLDIEKEAFADLGGHAAIVPGKPEESELVRRINGIEPNKIMPPRKTGKKLSAHEIDLLTRWVKQGARYAQHWSYVKPIRPALPAIKDSTWSKNPIDSFLLARLEREGLQPSPAADRYALIRRASLDLTGLPPTLQEVEEFSNDPDPLAYEKLVDRLLNKSTYGEYWAHLWLDLARYADSAGYADDPPRTIWLFRDYVIKALNANKPFDQFTIEQIAGDLLPDATEEQRIASAFHRNTLTNNEGGTNDEEFRNVAIVDRVNTTVAVWMGTTIACAQCHNHKYDPITQEEFFKVFAIFNNTADADRSDEAPLLSLYSEKEKRQRNHWKAEIARFESELRAPAAEIKAAQPKWEESFPNNLEWQIVKPTAVKTQGKAATVAEDGGIHVAEGAWNDTYTVEVPLAGAAMRALRIEALPDDKLPSKGPGYADGNFIISRISATIRDSEGKSQPIAFHAAVADYAQADFAADNVLDNKDPRRKGWSIGGQVGQAHAITLVSSATVPIPARATLVVTIEQAAKQPRHVLGHFRLSISDDARAIEWGRTPLPVLAILKIPAEQRSPDQQDAVAKHYLSVAPALQPTRQRLAVLRKQLADLKPATVPVMVELSGDQRRKTRIQLRGNYLDLAKEVTEGTPAAFPPLPTGAPPNRLTLAKWLVDENNPLTARVIANRYWEQIFGIGIVSSSEEFGAQGDLPFHQELLDWLATELVRLKWDMKAFVKLLVTSAAYRQSSRVTPELEQRDPENRLLARGPRFRLSAETVRDQALFLSGLLSPKMFGPPVKPPQPVLGVSAAFGGGIDWQTSAGDDRYRRALYTLWRRSNPYPSMATFDAPNREVCTVRRGRTNTPLQALVTLNDPVYVEASQALARLIVADGGCDAHSKARHAFRICLSRPPKEEEVDRLAGLYDQTLAQLQRKPEQARKLAAEPLGAAPKEMHVPELAAWTIVANVLLNLDEVLMKR